MRTGPIVIAHDGSPAADYAIEEARYLFGERGALVVTVWEPGPALSTLGAPSPAFASLKIRSPLNPKEVVLERAQSLAEQVAERARAIGLRATGLAVIDDLTIGETIVRVATERQAPAIVLGTHGHTVVREVLIGSTTREVLRHALCPVVVVRVTNDEADPKKKDQMRWTRPVRFHSGPSGENSSTA